MYSNIHWLKEIKIWLLFVAFIQTYTTREKKITINICSSPIAAKLPIGRVKTNTQNSSFNELVLISISVSNHLEVSRSSCKTEFYSIGICGLNKRFNLKENILSIAAKLPFGGTKRSTHNSGYNQLILTSIFASNYL